MTKNRVVVGVHQPHLLPWPPYIARVLHADAFVLLDSVAFRKNYYQNRVLFLDALGKETWFSLPVGGKSGRKICDIRLGEVAGLERAVNKQHRFLDQTYARSPHYQACRETILEFLRRIKECNLSLAELGEESIRLIGHLLEVELPPIACFSDLGLETAGRTERIAGAVLALGGDTFLSGWGQATDGRVHDLGLLRREGIDTYVLDKVEAETVNPQMVQPGVSTLHYIFKQGPAEVRNYLLALGMSIRPEVAHESKEAGGSA